MATMARVFHSYMAFTFSVLESMIKHWEKLALDNNEIPQSEEEDTHPFRIQAYSLAKTEGDFCTKTFGVTH